MLKISHQKLKKEIHTIMSQFIRCHLLNDLKLKIHEKNNKNLKTKISKLTIWFVNLFDKV